MSITIIRSERRPEFLETSTLPEKVGPGAYNEGEREICPSPVPFLSVQNRESTITNEIPGPGSYYLDATNLSSLSRSDPRSAAFRNKAPRFAPNCPGANIYNYPSSYLNPGPGVYHDENKEFVKTSTIEKPPKEKAGTRTNFGNKSFTLRKPERPQTETGFRLTIPSIPSKKVARKGYKGVGKDTVGPNHYTPSFSIISGRVRGTAFSGLKEKRKTSTSLMEEKPGPGTYDFDMKAKVNHNIFGNAAFINANLNTSNIQTKEANPPTKKETPGPGAYIPGGSEKLVQANTSNFQGGFGTITERKDFWSHDPVSPFTEPERLKVPGPGHYSRKVREDDIRARIINQESLKVPFGISDERDCNKKDKPSNPGPGTYIDVNNPIYSSVTRGILKFATDRGIMQAQGLASGPFGSTSERFNRGVFEPKSGPGPAHYSEVKTERETEETGLVYEKYLKPKSNSQSCMFRSQTNRFTKVDPNLSSIHIVGGRKQGTDSINYDNLRPKWIKKSVDTQYIKPGKFGFNSSGTKSQSTENAHNANPGPGYYYRDGGLNVKGTSAGNYGAFGRAKSSLGNSSSALSHFNSSQPRFSKVASYRPGTGTNRNVGPGTYEVDASMLKKTYNMSMENSFYL